MMVNKKSSIRKKSQGDYQKEYVSSAKRGIKGKLFLTLVVLMLCACSSDDELESSFNGANATRGVTYLTVNLREVGSTTRATQDGYASGTEAERKVANVYFYFYDDEGNYITRGNVGETSGTVDEPTSTNQYVEWNSGTVVAVYGLQKGGFPTQMLTVVNQPSSFNITNKTLSEATTTLAGTPYADASDNFVMSTSTYYGSSGIVNTTSLSSNNFALEPIDVDADYGTSGDATPVEVYVERLAAKVGVSNGIIDQTLVQNSTDIYTLTTEELAKFPMGAPTARNSYVGGIGIQLQGWNVDGVARDAYMSKQIDTSWSLSFTWNAMSNYRTYWADSPNYGVEHNYPTTSYNSTSGTANTDATEGTVPLDEYLRYVSLNDGNTHAFGSTDYAYCGENTNTVGTNGVIQDATSTGLTNVIVKAQFVDYNPNGNPQRLGIDIVEYQGSYYTVADFCQTYVYKNFANTIGNAITALESESDYSGLSSELEALKTAATNGSVYKTLTSVTSPTAADTTSFGGEMLSLYNAYDGNVTIGYNMDSSTIDNNIVYNGLALNDYNFWFSVDADELNGSIDALTTAALLVPIYDDNENVSYYIPLSTGIELTEQNTMRSYFLSALAADATATNSGFITNSSYPNYYKEGLMYYHVPIEHLGSAGTNGALTEGEYGVVRNHWYDVTITSLNSFGRGIAVEDEVIVPIGDNGIQTTSIGASTKIYSWKEYDQTVIF